MAPDESTRASGTGDTDYGKPAAARLTIERRMNRQVEGEAVTVYFGNQMLIGRDESGEITVDDDRVSRKHGQVRIDRHEAKFSDLGSTNGTTRNGDPVNDEIIIQTGDLLNLGKAITFEVKVVERRGEVTSVRLASGASAYLLVPQEMVIGFADPANKDVDLAIYDPSILKHHARLEYFTGQAFIVSLDKDKRVLVNSSPVTEEELRGDYMVEIGDTLIRYEKLD